MLDAQRSRILFINSVTQADAGLYQVVVSNKYKSVYSDPASVIVSTNGLAPYIIFNPISVSAEVGNSATLFVESGGDNLRYQWYKDDQALDVLDAQRSRTLFINSVTQADAGNYRVAVANGYGSSWSWWVTLYVTEGLATTPTPPHKITSQLEV